MVNLQIIAGGYTSFVATYLFNSDTSSLTLTSQSNTDVNPSWIAFHPVNKSILYAVNEDFPGALQSFSVGSDGRLSDAIANASTGGDGPAFTAPIGSDLVAVMNFGSGNGMIIPTIDAATFTTDANVIQFPAPKSNPHMALQAGNEVLVPDLGADKIWRLIQPDATQPGHWEIQGFIQQPNASGPRHIAMDGKFLFTLHETANTLTSQELPAAPNGTSDTISSFSIIPPDAPANTSFGAAEILFPTPNQVFTGRYVYVSNRNIGNNTDPRGDTIAIFSTNADTGELALVTHVFTGLQQIRGMQIGGPDDRFLIAGGSADGGVAMFERTGDGGNLTLLARNTDIPTRTTFVFFDDGSSTPPAAVEGASANGAVQSTSKQNQSEEQTSAPSKPQENSALKKVAQGVLAALAVQAIAVAILA